MDEDDDVERLFSWLQTPELRYREFAGAREMTETIQTSPVRPNTAETPLTTRDDAPIAASSMPARADARPTITEPVAPVPPSVPAAVSSPVAPPAPAGPFALGAGGRGIPRHPEYTEPVAPPPEPMATPASPAASAYRVVEPEPAAPASVPPEAEPAPPAAPPAPAAASPGGRLLGGAFRESGQVATGGPVVPPPSDSGQGDGRSLDAVFGRLSGARNRLPDPRDRLRNIPGLGPPPGKPR